MWLKIIVIVSFCIFNGSSSPSGAPAIACDNMTPNHNGNLPQQGDPPVRLEVPQWFISGQPATIKIISSIGRTFRGFKIQARNQADQLIGSFQPSQGVGTINCAGISNSAATHTSRTEKTEIEITWIPPQTEEIMLFNIYITIVENFSTFWARYRVPGFKNVIPPNLITTTEEVTDPVTDETTDPPTEEPTTEPDPENTTPVSYDNVYQGCGETKVCFGRPNLCYLNRNCLMFGAVTFNNYNFTFELLSADNHNYIAMGLSNTNRMPDSSVIECVRSFGISAFSSWTNDHIEADRSNIDPNIIQLVEWNFINGRVYCKVERVAQSIVNNVNFDLVNKEFYLLLASGIDFSLEGVGKHQYTAYSYDTVDLTTPRNVGMNKQTSPMILIHGSFMIVSWIGLTSIGIVMARYFKKSWSNKTMCGKDVWFIWHVSCMVLTWAFTIAGVIIIFVYLGRWSTSAHAVMGCVVLFFTVIHPIGAVFRPDPKDTARPLFNWFHKAFGNIAHVLAVITIFFAVGFPKAGLPHYTLYILAAFVSFYLFMHIIFTSIDICGEMRRNKNWRNANSKAMPYQILQKTLLGFFITSILIFVITLLLVFVLDFNEL